MLHSPKQTFNEDEREREERERERERDLLDVFR